MLEVKVEVLEEERLWRGREMVDGGAVLLNTTSMESEVSERPVLGSVKKVKLKNNRELR